MENRTEMEMEQRMPLTRVQAEKLVLPVMVQVRCAEVPDFLPFSRLVLPVTEAVLQ